MPVHTEYTWHGAYKQKIRLLLIPHWHPRKTSTSRGSRPLRFRILFLFSVQTGKLHFHSNYSEFIFRKKALRTNLLSTSLELPQISQCDTYSPAFLLLLHRNAASTLLKKRFLPKEAPFDLQPYTC